MTEAIQPTLPTLEEKNKQAATPETQEVKESRNAETDAYISIKQEEKRRKRGGVRERIDQLTKEAAEAKEQAAEAKKLAEAAKAAPAPVTVSVQADTISGPDLRPKREDFTDESEFTAKIAAWVVRQQAKIIAQPIAVAEPPKPAAPAEVTFDPANPAHAQLKTEFDGFLETGREYIKTHTDFNDRLNDAAKRGLTLDNAAQRAIIKLKAPEVLYYLSDPANEPAARSLMRLDAVSQVVEIGLIYDKLKAKPSDFISNAGRPGIRLTNGNTRATIPVSEMDTDDYIRQRRDDIRAGRRRR